MKSLLFILLVAVLAKAILLYKTINQLPLNELRRRARTNKSKDDQNIYKLAAYKSSLSLFIWLVGGLSAGIIIIWLARGSWLLAVLFVLIISWVIFSHRFSPRPGGHFWQLAGILASPAAGLLSFFHPTISAIIRDSWESSGNNKIFDHEDLIALLDKQTAQVDNRIDERELKIAKGALGFIHKTVSQVMTPAKEVKWLSGSDAISPKLMDELHKTGHQRFPVVKGSSKSSSPEIIGGLYINDLLKNLDKKGAVSDLMVGGSNYIGESHTLYQALDAFLKSKQHLLVVVNNFEEITGILSLETVLKQILGEDITTDFENYHNKHAVAGHEAGHPKPNHQQPEPIEEKESQE